MDLNESEKKELIAFISNLKEFLAYQKAEDEIAQEFLLHMNVPKHNYYLGCKRSLELRSADTNMHNGHCTSLPLSKSRHDSEVLDEFVR